MPRRNRDNLGKFLPNTPTTLNNQPSLFFSSCEFEDPLGEQPEILEEPTGAEEEGQPIPTNLTAENRNDKEDREIIKGSFPIRLTNGDTKKKSISPSALPQLHGLTSEDADTLLFEFSIIYRTYNYTTNEKKLKIFPSTLKDAALHWFMSLTGASVTTWAHL